eukprot:c11932_g2_i2.p1 GENE.c11932_g2_i2~~c11932_g2_i2.p1  ORF type:complete len:310 (+),score=46.43 c11932_g2_i2:27-956(+)
MSLFFWLLGDERFADLAVVSPTGALLTRCHKSILASASDTLCEQLSTPDPVLTAPSLPAALMVLAFIYQNRLPHNVEDTKTVQEACELAISWGLHGLARVLCRGAPSVGKPAAALKSVLNVARLWDKPEHVDVHVCLLSGSSEDDCVVSTFPASRAILAAQSEFFRSMFTRLWTEGDMGEIYLACPGTLDSVDEESFGPEDLEVCIRFMYGRIPNTFGSSRLLRAAVYLGMEDLQHRCEQILAEKHLTLESVGHLWRAAADCGADNLASRCSAFTATNFFFLSQADHFTTLDFELLQSVPPCNFLRRSC